MTALAILIEAVRQRTDRGASLVEYALLLALIAVVCLAAVATLGGAANSTFQSGATGW